MDEQTAFGNYLRAERELRQIPLSEVSTATKIPIKMLENLEVGHWDDLPAEVFVRGFIRSYSRHIGLPLDEAFAKYNDSLEQIAVINERLTTEPVGESATEMEGGRSRFGLALFVLIILIIATLTLSILWRSGASADTSASLHEDSLPGFNLPA